MHVRYLQHHGETVQLLLMPLSTAPQQESSFKSSKWSEKVDDQEKGAECEPVPLPIQTFLWRQTNPFLGAKIGKLHESSCVTFERVIVQNILHGLSPSLSDAIASISRWRLVRAAFPHIIQCCGSLLMERANEDEAQPMNGSLVKILYIMHWLLLDAVVECNENNFNTESGTALNIRQLTYSISCIQLFVYLLAPVFNAIKEEEIEGHIRLESGLRIWQALWQNRSPDVLCFCAPVKQRKNTQLAQQFNVGAGAAPWSRKVPTTTTAVEQGIYLGEESTPPPISAGINRRFSRLNAGIGLVSISPIPPPKPPRTDLNVLKEIQQQIEQPIRQVQESGLIQPLLPPTYSPTIGGIVRSVSDYKTCELANAERQCQREKMSSMRKSRTDIFHHSPDSDTLYNSIKNMDENMHLTTAEDGGSSFSSEIFQLNDKAPLVRLNDICSAASVSDIDSAASTTLSTFNVTANSEGLQRHASNLSAVSESKKRRVSIKSDNESTTKHLDVSDATIPSIKSPSADDSSSLASQQTVIASYPAPPKHTQFPEESAAGSLGEIERFHRADSIHSEKLAEMAGESDPNEASYLDVAILRCLLIRNWQEEGIFWAVKYLLNRLTDMRHKNTAEVDTFRSRANSLPTTTPYKGPEGSKFDADYLTWADLQDKIDSINKKLLNMERKASNDSIRLKVEFDHSQDVSDDSPRRKWTDDQNRRVSINTLPPLKKFSKSVATQQRRLERSKSEPYLSHNRELTEVDTAVSITPLPPMLNLGPSLSGDEGRKAQNFMPEAIGSSTFIEKNGHLLLPVVLKTLGSLIDHCGVVRINEVVLNICDTLLNMPTLNSNADHQLFFLGIVKLEKELGIRITHKNLVLSNEEHLFPLDTPSYLFALGLSKRLQRGDADSTSGFPQNQKILKAHVVESQCQQLLDSLHAMTMFCQLENEKDKDQRQKRSSVKSRRRSSDGRTPSYRNHFNETQSGIEGIVISILLTPLVSKLMRRKDDFSLPENTGLYQDVRMFIAYVQEKHGNPLRKTALSALAARTCSTRADQLDIGRVSNGDSRSLNESASGRLAQEGSTGSSAANIAASCQRDNASLRRGLFKGKERTSEGMAPVLNVTEEEKPQESEGDSSHSSSPTPRQQPSSIDESLSNVGSPLLVQHAKKKTGSGAGGGKLQFALNLLKSVKTDNSEEECWDEANTLDESVGDESSLTLGVEIGKIEGKIRTSFRSSSVHRNSNFRQKTSLTADNSSVNDYQEKSFDKQQQSIPPFLPPRQLVVVRDVREGAGRFAFLLETCRPGQLPDAPLIAALMELKAPVLSRAVLLLECANFVHRCNRGDWPEGRNAVVGGTGGSGNAAPASFAAGARGGSRKTFLLQRAAGRHFYSWAVQIAARLQRMLEAEEQFPKADEDKKVLRVMDDLEDFLDDGTVNDSSGEGCPAVLQLMACMLLLQITAFLRETFQMLPRSKVSHKNTSSTTGWEKLMSHRRWSILSNTFNPQTTGSIHSINDLHPAIQPERRISYSTADEESSPRGSHDLNADDQPVLGNLGDKKDSHDASNLLWTLRRFASRSRLFSQEQQPVAADDESVSEQGSTRSKKAGLTLLQQQSITCRTISPPSSFFLPQLQHHHTHHHQLNGSSSASGVSSKASGVPEQATVRRLAQGRQRLLKRGSPSTQQGVMESNNRKRESLRIRKPSRSPMGAAPVEAEETNESGGCFAF